MAPKAQSLLAKNCSPELKKLSDEALQSHVPHIEGQLEEGLRNLEEFVRNYDNTNMQAIDIDTKYKNRQKQYQQALIDAQYTTTERLPGSIQLAPYTKGYARLMRYIEERLSENIREGALAVQETWDEPTRLRREGRRVEDYEGWEPPIVRTPDLG